VTRRWGKRCTHLVECINKIRRYCKFTEEALYHTMWRTCFGRGYGPVTRQTMEWMHINYSSLEVSRLLWCDTLSVGKRFLTF
jgi:ABC-type ATPase with predicted acetyltransferase domain